MIPSNHGSIAWVYRGLGNYCGFLYCVNDSFSTLIDLPTYIVLIGIYCQSWLNSVNIINIDNNIILYFFMFTIVLIATILNIFDVQFIGRFSVFLTLIILIPLITAFFITIPKINPSVWFDTTTIESCNQSGICNYALYFSSLIWLYSGWDTLSNLNGEIGFQLSDFLKQFLYAIIIDVLSYIIPLVTIFTISFPKWNNYKSVSNWYDGYLNEAYFDINHVLGWFVFAAAIASNFSLHYCQSITLARELWAMAQDDVPKSQSLNSKQNSIADINTNNNESRAQRDGTEYNENSINVHANDMQIHFDRKSRRTISLAGNRISTSHRKHFETRQIDRDTGNEVIITNDHDNYTRSSIIVGNLNMVDSVTFAVLGGHSNNTYDNDNDNDNDIITRQRGKTHEMDDTINIKINVLPKWFGYLHKKTKAPLFAILIIFIANCLLLPFSFAFLIQLGTVQNCFSFLFEYASLVSLRYKEPNEERPFKIPFGLIGVWSIALIKFSLISVLIVLVFIQTPTIILFCFGYNVAMTIYYFCWIKHDHDAKFKLFCTNFKLNDKIKIQNKNKTKQKYNYRLNSHDSDTLVEQLL